MKKAVYLVGALLLSGAFLAVSSSFDYGGSVNAAEEHAAGALQAMPVDMMTVKPEAVQVWSQFSGHVVAVDQAEIRPQVSGRITEIKFEDGQYVNKDDILLIIDPRPYEATLTQARAALQKAETDLIFAKKEYARSQKLIKTSAVSESLVDERASAQKASEAAVLEAKAMVEKAEIDVDYAHVKAPISGKISRAEVTEGNLVQAGPGAPLLTSIVADDKVYVDFEVDDQTYLECARGKHTGDVKTVPVRVKLAGVDEPYEGFIHSFDNRIDAASGTIRARAIFENADKMLLPGMSVSVMVGKPGGADQIVVTERAIGTDQDRKFVYVVDENGMTSYREVKIGESVVGKRIILSGLKAGEQVITEGIMRLRPGMPVTAKTAELTENNQQK
ncbi:MAG: efflux RND transporter periplasmic adaptor subunit [Alphaproteobacteria bacterium]|nr:efflux RND transporter periplasmic adaptor subunit [Alphaproteobacteria bacterium]MCD8570459.1 efflux RND transporter periplasmic adaptor subunit [Alphaproteobacteria bacterium]